MTNGRKNDLTELVFILDRSGSMAGLESDTVGGFNSIKVPKIKNALKKCVITAETPMLTHV